MSTIEANEPHQHGSGGHDAAGDIHNEGFANPSKVPGGSQNDEGQGSTFRDDARQARERLNEGASSAARDIKARAASFADEQRKHGAERMEGVASVVDRAADDLERELPEAADLVRGAARGLSDLSRNLRDRDTADLVGSISDFARREPAAFFGGAVLAGFALSRFLKSSSERAGGQTYGSYARSHQAGSERYDAASTAKSSGVGRPDDRGSWPEMEEASVAPATRREASWDRPSDSPTPADAVSPTEPGMGYTQPNAYKN